MLDLKNKKVLVTGASNGLGLKIAKSFAEAGSVGFGFDLKINNFDIKEWSFSKVDISDEEEVLFDSPLLSYRVGNLN